MDPTTPIVQVKSSKWKTFFIAAANAVGPVLLQLLVTYLNGKANKAGNK